MKESQITITMQDVVPSVNNVECELSVDANGHLIRKPHGHGDIHLCLYRVGFYIHSFIHSFTYS